ncbi:DUF202 domain-containing protein [Sulfitobacter mediterraneus]|jgi:putative membrane protein|uniref:YidH family protein n=1 Tax=Sulfitobacter TaxID=60136 RepID=UPI0019336B8D|nr:MULTISPECIES: DUF202 domain-containing protein [Sulfitobacter]MBM1633319.1 DUF202 domain-containing protein [Sulfitobacter mediterraneus]MBM1640547.1 DUF202 domain-containing protein [Sulfitobacter mediterraneus]MBM1645184.1 DUF202 domain-containing protein [Sulfitobacter mediterraneus]MBM1648667.1 DUF202 domain-containing protein [Sulfitobacter mediterraneus]MBM1652688.1 DUF202 domain-containing protein [Sulfitobacter mediterraneus]
MNDSNEMAKDRTDWAEDRTILANERTFAGWMRTGMASLAIAVGLKAVFGAFDPTWLAKSVASVFVLIAIYIFWAAQQQSRRTLDRLSEHQAASQPHSRMRNLAIAFIGGSIATGAILWTL